MGGKLPKKRGLGQTRKRGSVLRGGGVHTPMHTMITPTATRYPAISDKFPEQQANRFAAERFPDCGICNGNG